jgi:hypothetical protein
LRIPVSYSRLIVLIGASNSFTRVSATPEREACIPELVNRDVTLMESIDPLSNAVICLSQSESDIIEIGPLNLRN